MNAEWDVKYSGLFVEGSAVHCGIVWCTFAHAFMWTRWWSEKSSECFSPRTAEEIKLCWYVCVQVKQICAGWSSGSRSCGIITVWNTPWPRAPKTCWDFWVLEKHKTRKPSLRWHNTHWWCHLWDTVEMFLRSGVMMMMVCFCRLRVGWVKRLSGWIFCGCH